MLKRILAIGLIFVCTSAAWFVLGSTIEARTYRSDGKLRSGVATIWGAPQQPTAPAASIELGEPRRAVDVALESSRIQAAFELEHRQKGLLWYSTYWVNLDGVYRFRNATSEPQAMAFRLRFPADHAIYDGLVMEVNGHALPLISDAKGAQVTATVPPQETASLRVAYRSRGLESWIYKLGDEVTQTRDFELRMKTNFRQIDFPGNGLSPTEKRQVPGGWELVWKYSNLISGFQIGLVMPEKLQPGPLAGQISYFAPVSLLLFFFLMFIITTLRGIDLHPMNYFFLATAFFAFHLLLAYLVDLISIHLAFLICSVVSIFLVVSYLRIVVGPRFAWREAGGAQFIYLVLFSYAFFLEGYTGLAVTIGCIVTLFVVMQLTARIRWSERFA
jgi:Inner membrane protein CreD